MRHLLDKPFLEAVKATRRDLSGPDVVGSRITQSLHDKRSSPDMSPPETLHVNELMKNVGNDSRQFSHSAEFHVCLLTQLFCG